MANSAGRRRKSAAGDLSSFRAELRPLQHGIRTTQFSLRGCELEGNGDRTAQTPVPLPAQAATAWLVALNKSFWGAVGHGVPQPGRGPVDGRLPGARGGQPRVIAAFENLAISILRLPRVKTIKHRTEQLTHWPDLSLRRW